MGAKKEGMGNICELLINVVKWNKPKVLTGLNQKVRGTVRVFYIHSAQSTIPPANKQALTRPVE
jgi:hypothetical protein